ncbi:hypothetical protein TVAG_126660 [Trichomonas vaginalis G3]|uniref:F5/8 type C domain-containing protein n=1 Tax=Trichomonas vaginalis (strain ATCC PRA-98 / G3) TaxID=412133 RepID=A2FHS6_TRIV3|nr:galactose-binding domain-like family [Trichomonas vaginalis G3]EAX95536.1 hypothetical protein TVAG_126660 [Trichomonas vaginalis G3]KAI5514391.1 galactose-binding domain-like family [Trichomonas vaginalis G3]|eukprot:XP_001308466.1 hypothetical protein [Trichomonas vaginalis G3]
MLSLLFSISKSQQEKGIFQRVFHDKVIDIDVSGSSKQYINSSLQLTKPEYAIYPWNKDYDWCSNCGKTYDDHPYITFSIKNKKMKIDGYYVRAGCCYGGCCCEDDSYCVYCCLYSWSLQISDDNKTWKDIHHIEKDSEMKYCREKSYKLDKTYTARYFRVFQTSACPGEPPCLAINKFDLIGDVVANDDINDVQEDFVSFHDDDEDISIIGHIGKNAKI